MKMSSMVGVCTAMALCLAVGTAQAGPGPGKMIGAKSKQMGKKSVKKVAKKVPHVTSSGQEATRLDPTRVAGIRKLANGKYEMTTEWMPYTGVGNDTQDTLVFDAAQVDPATGIPYGGGECGIDEGSRWLLEYNPGTFDFHNPNTSAPMKVSDADAGAASGRVTFLFYWNDSGAGFYIAHFTSEDASIDCSLPGADNYYDGIIFGFDPNGTGFYYTDADTEADGLFYTMPSDGEGGYTMIVADSFDGETLTLAAGPTQPGLWGTANNGGIKGRPGESMDPTFADIDPTDGEWTDNECFTYAYGVCPDPLSNAVSYWRAAGGEECYADCNGDKALDIFDFFCFQNAFVAQDAYANCNGDGIIDLFDFLCYQNAFVKGCP